MVQPTDVFIFILAATPLLLPSEKYPPHRKLLISFFISFILFFAADLFLHIQANVTRNTEDNGGVPKGVVVEIVPR